MRLRLAVVGNQAKETREAQGGAEEAKEAQEGRRAQEERQAQEGRQAQELRQAHSPPSHLTWMQWQQKSLQDWALGQLAAVAVAAAVAMLLRL